MMSRHLMVAGIVAVLAGAASLAAQSRSAEVQFKAAEQKELVEGDLKGAIKEFERIAKGSNRALAAQAMLRIAAIHAKLGDAEARKVYERVVRDFPDQTGAVAVARARLGEPAPSAQTVKLKRPIPFRIEGLVFTMGLSADGRYISARGSMGELTFRDTRTGMTRAVTGTPKERQYEFASYGVFSRDGKQFAFQASGPSLPQSELRVVDLQERGIPRSRAVFAEQYVQPFGWTPDAQSIAVVVVRRDTPGFEFGIVSVATRTYRPLKKTEGTFTFMFLSPDGQFIAADLGDTRTAPRDLFVIRVADGRETRIEHPANDLVMGWSPDNRHLLFSSDRNTGSLALYGQRLVNGQPEGLPRLIDRDWGPVFPLGVTSGGALFYAPSPVDQAPTATEIKVVTLDVERGALRSTPKIVPEERPGSVDLPAWSADGKFLAYRLMRPGRSTEQASIIIRSVDTGQSRELMPGIAVGTLSWHADGKSLVAGQTAPQNQAVVRIDATSGEVTHIAPGTNARSAPDGRTVYLRRPGPAEAGAATVVVVARDLTTGAERELVRRRLGPGLSLSPDGRFISMNAGPLAENNRVVIVPTDGGEAREIALPRTGTAMVWSADSRSIIARARDGNEAWRVSLDGAVTTLPLDSPWSDTVGGLALHPDGMQLAFTSVATVTKPESGIRVLENFLSALDDK